MNAKKWLSVVMVFVFSLCALAQDEPVVQLSQDYRLDVKTNRDVLGDGDVLTLSLSLLNNGTHPAAFLLDSNTPVITQNNTELLAGVMDDQPVDVEIITPLQNLIGYAEIRPLNSLAGEAKHIRLPLFGAPRIQPHSTRIVSLANIYIALAEPNLIDSNDVGDELETGQQVELVQAAGKYLAERPGLYVITCYIDKLANANIAQAQTIVRIARPQPNTIERTIRKIDQRTEKPYPSANPKISAAAK